MATKASVRLIHPCKADIRENNIKHKNTVQGKFRLFSAKHEAAQSTAVECLCCIPLATSLL